MRAIRDSVIDLDGIRPFTHGRSAKRHDGIKRS